eukprot:1522411-Pyramimonas_sp.AAC.1
MLFTPGAKALPLHVIKIGTRDDDDRARPNERSRGSLYDVVRIYVLAGGSDALMLMSTNAGLYILVVARDCNLRLLKHDDIIDTCLHSTCIPATPRHHNLPGGGYRTTHHGVYIAFRDARHKHGIVPQQIRGAGVAHKPTEIAGGQHRLRVGH